MENKYKLVTHITGKVRKNELVYSIGRLDKTLARGKGVPLAKFDKTKHDYDVEYAPEHGGYMVQGINLNTIDGAKWIPDYLNTSTNLRGAWCVEEWSSVMSVINNG